MDKPNDKTATQRFIGERINELLLLENRARKEREILQKTLEQLRGVEDVIEIQVQAPMRLQIPNGPAPRPVGHNALVLSMIIEESGKPLSVREIAQTAHKTGQIKSALGYKGVYNIVQTVLKRNRKTFFKKVGRGVWDVRDHINHDQQSDLNKAIDQVARDFNRREQQRSEALNKAIDQVAKNFGRKEPPE